MASAGVAANALPTDEVMNKAAEELETPEIEKLLAIGLSKFDAEGMTRFGRDGGWEASVVEKVMSDRGFTCVRNNFNPDADAWIVNTGGHWYAYTQTANGEWFNVDSLYQSKKHFDEYQDPKYKGTHSDPKNFMRGPQYVQPALGETSLDAMQTRIATDSKRGCTVYHVKFPAHMAHGAAPAESQGKDNGSVSEHKSDTETQSDSDMELGNLPPLPAPTTPQELPQLAAPQVQAEPLEHKQCNVEESEKPSPYHRFGAITGVLPVVPKVPFETFLGNDPETNIRWYSWTYANGFKHYYTKDLRGARTSVLKSQPWQ